MKKIVVLLIAIFIYISNLSSQELNLSMGKVSACKGDTISVPVIVKGFSNICAVGVRMLYDTLKLKYLDCIDINASLPGADFAKVQKYITLGWFSINDNIKCNINDNGILFKVKFFCLASSSELQFEESGCSATDCELKDLKLIMSPSKILPNKKCK